MRHCNPSLKSALLATTAGMLLAVSGLAAAHGESNQGESNQSQSAEVQPGQVDASTDSRSNTMNSRMGPGQNSRASGDMPASTHAKPSQTMSNHKDPESHAASAGSNPMQPRMAPTQNTKASGSMSSATQSNTPAATGSDGGS